MTLRGWWYYWKRRHFLTEAEWLECPDSKALMIFIPTRTSQRKVMLCQAACCRRVWADLGERDRALVEEWERFADGASTRAQEEPILSTWNDPGDIAWDHAGRDGVAQSALVRDMIGNPFRPVAADPAWLSYFGGMIAQVVRVIYDDRQLPAGTLDPARLAVLADALEDAGCTDADILSHLRGPGPHVRGCWAVDLLLGKR